MLSKRFSYSLLFLFSLTFNLITPQTNLSNQKNDIRGYIKDAESGEALVYANIVIEGTTQGATTNKRGYFVIADAAIGKHALIVSYIGYTTQKIEIDNKVGASKVLSIELKSKTFESDEVVVTADEYKIWKSAKEVSQITISPKQISLLPQLGEVDIFRALQLLPGISGVNDGSAGLYVRGGTPDQNLVLLDGMTVYHVDHFFGFFSAFNAEAIKDVQIYKGGYPAKFGGRLSSVVDLTGKTGDVNKFKLSLGANLLSVNGVAQIPISGKGSLLISARRSYADFLNSGTYSTIYDFLSGGESETSTPQRRGPFNQAETEVLPSFYFYDLNAKLSYQVTDKDFLSISFYNGEDFLDESEEPQQFTMFGGDNTGTRSSDDITNWGNLGSSLKWSRQWNNRLFSDYTIAYSNYFSDYNFENIFNSNAENDTSGLPARSFTIMQNNDIGDFSIKLDNEWDLNKDHKISIGLWGSSIRTKYEFVINDSLQILDSDVQSLQSSLYLQDQWKISDDLDISFGIRGTYFDKTNGFYFEPRASFTYSILDNFKLKGAWGQNYQFINRITNEDVLEGNRDFWMLSDEDLKPGFSENFILGTEYETTDFLFSVEGYYRNLDNLKEFSQRTPNRGGAGTGSAEDYLANFFLGSGVSKGIEFLAQKKMGAFNGWLSYTLGKVDYTFPDYNDGASFPASHDRRHEVKLVSTYSIGKWNLSGTWVFASGNAYTAPESQYYITLLNGETESYIHVSDKNGYRLPDYHRLDLSAAYKFKNKKFDGEFGLSVFNVYNNKNIWYKKYDLDVSPVVITDIAMLGITPTLFVKLNF